MPRSKKSWPNVCSNIQNLSKTSAHTSNVLDMSRALAALLVVLYHARVYVVVDPQGLLATVLYAITACGPQSVVWFFVISGYLVGGSVIQGIAANHFNFKSYLIARMSRLYLVLIPALAWCYLWDTLRIDRFGLNAHAGFETTNSLSFPTLLANLAFLETTYAPTYGSNFVLWSLASEFWYYLLFPLLMAPLMFNHTRIVRYGLLATGAVLLGVMAKRNFSMAWLFIPWLLGAAARISPWSLRSEATAWIIAALAVVAYPPRSNRSSGNLAGGCDLYWGIVGGEREYH